jgi:hypothetical protein
MLDLVNNFVVYVAESEPSFADKIRGASVEEIAKLEERVGTPLPESYRSYLSLFGKSDGGLDLGYGATTNIERVYDFYGDLIAEGNSPPPRCIVIAVEGATIGDTSLEIVNAAQEPRVVNTVDDQIKGLYADSLPPLLYRLAFMKYRAKIFPHSAIYLGKDTKPTLGQARDVALKAALVPQWFSDSVCLCCERPHAMVAVNQFAGQGPWVRISADERAIVESLGDAFAASLGVTFNRWWP